MENRNVFVTREELERQRYFSGKVLRRNAAISAETGYVPLAMVECYGCQQNEADAEQLRGMLAQMGYGTASCAEEADVVLVNTCAVREHAETRVLGNVGALGHIKQSRPGMIIGVCGCMPQQEKRADQLRKSYPYVNLVFGTHAVWKLPELLWGVIDSGKRVTDIEDSAGRIAEGLPVVRSNLQKAWVSIMYGCNNFCTYCIVPYVRGRERSRMPEDILAEVRGLAENGCRDITLLGQNVNSYGKDHGKMDFPDLLEAICAIPGDFTVRFMTSHPKDATKKLFDVMARNPKCARQLHLPVQCGSDRVLKEMNRHYTVAEYKALVSYAREKMPGLVLTSDIIVGFPGETEEDFAGTLSLIEDVRFTSLFTFLYSPRQGTPAARMPDPATHEEKQARFDRLLETQNRISKEIHESYVGTSLRLTLEEGRLEGYALSARTGGGRLVHIAGDASLAGCEASVRIERCSTFALYGKVEE